MGTRELPHPHARSPSSGDLGTWLHGRGPTAGVRMSAAVHSCALWLRLLVIAVDGVALTVVSCNQD